MRRHSEHTFYIDGQHKTRWAVHSVVFCSSPSIEGFVEMIVPCPKCEVYDGLVNDCVDPCFEYGPSSATCIEQSGCRTTTVDTTTMQTSSVTAMMLPVTARADTLTVAVVLVVAVVVGLLLIFIVTKLWWQRQRCRLAAINSRGT